MAIHLLRNRLADFKSRKNIILESELPPEAEGSEYIVQKKTKLELIYFTFLFCAVILGNTAVYTFLDLYGSNNLIQWNL